MIGSICGLQAGEYKGKPWCKITVLEQALGEGCFGRRAYEAKVSSGWFLQNKELLEEAIQLGGDVELTFDRYGRVVDIR